METRTNSLTVYLDSSDYSALSDPKRTTALEEIRQTLLVLRDKGARFVFSATHLAEMAPLQAQYTPYAAARADLLVALCGRNALISFVLLQQLETARLVDRDQAPVVAISDEGIWFPALGSLFGPVQAVTPLREALINFIGEAGYSSRQKRQVQRLLFSKEGTPRPRLRAMLMSTGGDDLNELLESYPMRPEDALVLFRYIAGEASAAEAEAAFLESLKDPSWMMRWFARHSEKLTPLPEWVRGPARGITDRLKMSAATARHLLDRHAGARDVLLSDRNWGQLEDEGVAKVAGDLVAQFHPGVPFLEERPRIDQLCPGLSTMVRVMYAVLRDALGSPPRNLRESDFVDALHTMYVPYVDIFRADRYMAPHVQQLAKRVGCTVVPHLELLPAAIKTRLGSNV
jgi:hypothetical protein